MPSDAKDEDAKTGQLLLLKRGRDDGALGSQASPPRLAAQADLELQKKRRQDLIARMLAFFSKEPKTIEGASLLPPPQMVQKRAIDTKSAIFSSNALFFFLCFILLIYSSPMQRGSKLCVMIFLGSLVQALGLYLFPVSRGPQKGR
jgi:hypothetical protein